MVCKEFAESEQALRRGLIRFCTLPLAYKLIYLLKSLGIVLSRLCTGDTIDMAFEIIKCDDSGVMVVRTTLSKVPTELAAFQHYEPDLAYSVDPEGYGIDIIIVENKEDIAQHLNNLFMPQVIA